VAERDGRGAPRPPRAGRVHGGETPTSARSNPADGSDPLLVQMRPDCVTIISEQREDDAGRIYKVPVGYAEDLTPLGITDRDPQVYTPDEVGALLRRSRTRRRGSGACRG